MNITYTHDSGLVIRVDQFDQVIEFDAGHVLGPFEPLDVDLTCAAITEEAMRTERFDWLSAASEWRRLNVEAELFFYDQTTKQFVYKLQSITIFDPDLGDLTYPPDEVEAPAEEEAEIPAEIAPADQAPETP